MLHKIINSNNNNNNKTSIINKVLLEQNSCVKEVHNDNNASRTKIDWFANVSHDDNADEQIDDSSFTCDKDKHTIGSFLSNSMFTANVIICVCNNVDTDYDDNYFGIIPLNNY